MAIGDNAFNNPTTHLDTLLKLHGLTVTAEIIDNSIIDIYGTPQNSPTTKQVTLIFTGTEIKEDETIGGGKTKELLYMFGAPGTVAENNIVCYNNHKYDVRVVGPSYIGGINQLESYIAVREVDI